MVLRGLVAAGFIAAGTLHFVAPRTYVAIIPPGFPRPDLLVAVSGAAEIAGGAELMIAATRRAAAWGLAALLVAVFPANLTMALNASRFAAVAPAWILWLRLPLQPALIALVFAVARR